MRTCLLLGTLALPFCTTAGEAVSENDRSHPSSFVKDSVMTTKIKAKLGEDNMSSLLQVSVDTDNQGSVTLGGRANTRIDADRAVAIARGTGGVTGVSSAIRTSGGPIRRHDGIQ